MYFGLYMYTVNWEDCGYWVSNSWASTVYIDINDRSIEGAQLDRCRVGRDPDGEGDVLVLEGTKINGISHSGS